MTEREFILAANLARLRAIANLLREPYRGEEFGIPEEEWSGTFQALNRRAAATEAAVDDATQSDED